jgi:hypothetical protein
VAETLRACHIFLATGFPEGCPLPPLESMACGCLVAGFAGFGGFDSMRQIDPGGFAPSVPLRDVPWGGNGCYAADHDVFGAAACLDRLAGSGSKADQPWPRPWKTPGSRAAYAPDCRRAALAALWKGGRTETVKRLRRPKGAASCKPFTVRAFGWPA